MILAPEWAGRAPLRAQLIEEGFEVVAVDTWESARRQLRPGMKPGLVIVDLHGLEIPETVLDDLRILMNPSRVLVLSALGTLPPAHVEGLGFHVLRRPVSVGDIVASVRSLLGPRGGLTNKES